MKLLLKLAWRNIWRNKRRTLITAASILFSVLFAALLSALQSGVWDSMIGNVVNYYYGFAQVQDSTYWKEKNINYAFEIDSVKQKIPEMEGLKSLVPRFENFSLASFGDETEGVLTVGINPKAEDEMTGLADRVTSGSYLSGDDTGVMIAGGIAESKNISLGDTLVLISQGYHGINAAGLFPVRAIIHFPSPELNKKMVYMSLSEAGRFFGAPGMATSLALNIEDQSEVAHIVKNLENSLGDNMVVKDWEQLMPDFVQARAVDTASARVILLVLYIIITFGIFGTVLMMVQERLYEFGVLLSIGLKRMQLFGMVWLEIFFIAFVGVLAGLILAYPIAYWFNIHPINLGKDMAEAYAQFGMPPEMPTSLNPMLFLAQAGIIFIVVILLSFYPLYQIRKLHPIEAMHA